MSTIQRKQKNIDLASLPVTCADDGCRLDIESGLVFSIYRGSVPFTKKRQNYTVSMLATNPIIAPGTVVCIKKSTGESVWVEIFGQPFDEPHSPYRRYMFTERRTPYFTGWCIDSSGSWVNFD